MARYRRRYLRAGALALAFSLFAAAGQAGPFEDGVKAFDAGDYRAARGAWLPLARSGDLAAMRNLGHLHRMGLAGPQDFAAALAWYRRAAEGGLARAQVNLALMLLRGQGIEPDAEAAARWLIGAAKAGDANGQYNLSLLYRRGQGVPRDKARALGWLYAAARQGHRPALERLAARVRADNRPFRRMTLADLNSLDPKPEASRPAPEPEPQPESGFLESLWDRLRGDADAPAPADTVEAALQRANLAFEDGEFTRAERQWLGLAETGVPEAQYQLGQLHREPRFQRADIAYGYFWLGLAAEQGHGLAMEAQRELATILNPAERETARALLARWRARARR